MTTGGRRRSLGGFVWAFALWCAACNLSPVRPCAEDKDCLDLVNEYCDKKLGACMRRALFDGGLGEQPVCAPECPSFQVCQAGNVCGARYQGIRLSAPAAGTVFRLGTTVLAELDVQPGVARNDPSELFLGVSGPGGNGSLSVPRVGDGAYGVTWAPSPDGPYTIVAAWPEAGLSSAPVNVLVDNLAPTFALELPLVKRQADAGAFNFIDPTPGYENAWRRDQVLVANVASDDADLVSASVNLVVVGVDGGGPGAPTAPVWLTATSGCGKSYCATVEVELGKPQLDAFRGEFALVVSGADRAGNVGAADAGLKVTRWKWEFSQDHGPIMATPAVGSSGRIYAGTGITPGGVAFALNPEGAVEWWFDAGTILGSLAVGSADGGQELVYVGTRTQTQARLLALEGQTGAVAESCDAGNFAIEGSLAVTRTKLDSEPSAVESAVGVINAPGGMLVAIRPGAAVTCVATPSLGGIAFPGNLVATEFFVLYGMKGTGEVVSYFMNPAGGGTWENQLSWPVNVGLFTNSLAVSGSTIVGGGGGGPGAGGVFAIPDVGGQVTWRFPASGLGPQAGSPTVGRFDEVFFGNGDGVLQRVRVGAASAMAQVATAAEIRAAPALGQAGLVYTVDAYGEVAAWDQDFNPKWRLPSAVVGTVDSSPALDCTRSPTGTPVAGRPGVLYVGSSATGKLYAFVVDSRGVDVYASWPKYQKDPRNTGSHWTRLTDFACP